MGAPPKTPTPAAEAAALDDDAACWRFGDITLDERTLELKLRGELRPLPPKPLEVLMVLVRRPGEVVTKEELFDAVWPRRIVSEASLTNAIVKLRSALGDDQQQIIKSAHGHGYRLMGTVVRETPLPASTPAPAFQFEPGREVPQRPDWLFHSRIGAGGQGEVWLATHRATKEKRVFKFARDESSLIGLKREVTLFRLLRENLGIRSDLVRLLDWNLEQSPCFIAAEYCAGGSLADWAVARGGLAKIPIAQRLELIAQTADALAAAHSLGALHKDVKPGNVLIAFDDEDRPHIRLADFGSARLLQRSRFATPDVTRMGFTQTIGDTTSGTPLYLAPEVIAGQPPTPQSDIYSLGVMLYQLVVGDLRQPLAPGWERNVDDELLREDIALAAAGDPAQRLDDAAQLAIRLRSLDQRRADRAREQQLKIEAETARKALERSVARRGLLRLLGITMALGLAATSVLLWQALRANGEARREAARANAVTEFLSQDLLTAANPVVAGRRDVTVREVLDGAVEQLDRRFADQPHTRASLQRVIGSAYAAMGEREKAESLLNPAIESLSAIAGPAAFETETARLALRDMYVNIGDFRLSIGMSATIAAAEQAAGNPNRGLALETQAMAAIGGCWGRHISEFVARCEDVAREQYARVLGALGPDDIATARTGIYTGSTLMRVGRFDEALPVMRAAVAGMERNLGVDNIWLGQSRGLLVETLVGAGRAQEALDRSLAKLEGDRKVYGADDRIVLNSRRWIAAARLDLGQTESAAAELDALYAEIVARPTTSPRDLGVLALVLVRADSSLRRFEPAESVLRTVLSRIPATEPKGGYWTLRLREALADVRTAQGDTAQAKVLLEQNLADARRLMTKGEWLLGWCAYRLGDRLLADGDAAAGMPLVQEGSRILDDSLGAGDSRSKLARARLAG